MKTSNLLVYFVIIVFLCLIIHPISAQDESYTGKKIDGYRGIWFTLGQFSEYGDKYSGGLGTYTAKHIPLAIYSPEVKKTFFVYGGTTGVDEKYLLCMIGSYDHKTKKVSKPVVVHDKEGVDDPHDNPSIALDGEGHIWVFVSGRGRKRMGFKYRSKQPYDITAFDLITEEEMTYPQPKFIPGKGFLNLFTKYTGVRELYTESSEDGVSWTPDRLLVAMKREGDQNSGHYQISGQHGEKVVFFCNWHPNGNVDQRTNIYYFQTTDFGKTWTTIEGEEIAIPVTDVAAPVLAKEFFSQGVNVYIKDVNFDSQGNPIALYVSGPGHQPGPKSGLRNWNVIHWNGSEWINHKITTSDQNYDSGSLWVNGDEWMVIGPTQNSPQMWGAGGELQQWKSFDKGNTWEMAKQITSDSPRNHNYARRVSHGIDPFLYFWADGNPNQFSISKLYFGDSKGRVWALPYEMDKETMKPKRIKKF
jgi:hypothetical protein